ncbi:MAG: EAL domain-containing protein [Huintestinicola sp.]
MSISINEAMCSYINDNSDMCVFVTDFTDGSFEISSPGCVGRLISQGSEPLAQLACSEYIHPVDKPVISAFCTDLLNAPNIPTDDRYNVYFRAKLDDAEGDEYKWLSFTVVIRHDDNGKALFVVGHILKMNKSELLTKTILDSFTNDKHPHVFTNQAVELLKSDAPNIAFIQLDVEKFKLINARYGEDTGNKIIDFIKNGLDTICGENQLHLRLTADVFMIATAFGTQDDIDRLINTIRERLSSYNGIRYKLVFGVCIVDDRTLEPRKFGDRAAMARQSMKGNALESVGYYKNHQEDKLFTRKFIEDNMYNALESGEFVMYLQPKYSIDKSTVVGAEALVRWVNPEKGMIFPMDFIPIFEQNGFIRKLDQFIWEQACRTIRSWIDSGIMPVPISINISRVHLDNDDFINILDRLIEKYGIDKCYIETEITETVENENSSTMIMKLKERGYKLLMDDFGSGYSSLNMLRTTSFDVVKIDREFFGEFMLSDRGKKIIAHTISMSKDIGLGLVAEGVETKEQAEFLYDCGCNIAQGYYYSRPININDFEKLAFNYAEK